MEIRIESKGNLKLTYSEIRDSSKVITLRGHHLLCIQGFQGYGYNPEFIHNLSQIIRFLDDNPYHKIKIVDECDDICLKCPFMIDNSCLTYSGANESIKSMDRAVMGQLDLNCHEAYNYHQLQEQVLSDDHFKELKKICGTCRWQKDCKFYNK